MKLVCTGYQMQIMLEENLVNTLIIENASEFTRLVTMMWTQTQAQDGDWVLSEEGKVLKLQEYMQCIVSPLSLELNSRKILDKIYEQCKHNIIDSALFLEWGKLRETYTSFMEKIIQMEEYPLVYDDSLDEKAFFKQMNMKLQSDSVNMAGKLVDYINVNSKLLGVKVFIFVNLKAYISTVELNQVIKSAQYLKCNLLFIEPQVREDHLCNEKIYVIDQDLCEIY